jgi:hypothetical protein
MEEVKMNRKVAQGKIVNLAVHLGARSFLKMKGQSVLYAQSYRRIQA